MFMMSLFKWSSAQYPKSLTLSVKECKEYFDNDTRGSDDNEIIKKLKNQEEFKMNTSLR